MNRCEYALTRKAGAKVLKKMKSEEGRGKNEG